jgi:DNA recombination protein RmuC
MNGSSILIALIALAAGVLVTWLLTRRTARTDGTGGTLPGDLGVLKHQLEELTRRLDDQFATSSRSHQDSFTRHHDLIRTLERDLTERLTKLSEGQSRVGEIADEIRGLQNILKNPKQRGTLGEYYLENALKNVLPPGSYSMQYGMAGGQLKADAVIHYEERIIPIDSKFSLENYNRFIEATDDAGRDKFEKAVREDLKHRIDETAKYIRPDDGTVEFALMFIPSEAIYYDLIVRNVGVGATGRSLIDYAHEKRVVPVSPIMFYAYLQTVLQGLRHVQFTKSAEEIRRRVGELMRHLKAYEDYFDKVGTGLGNASSAYDRALKEFEKIEKDVVRITGTASEAAELPLATPTAETEKESARALF